MHVSPRPFPLTRKQASALPRTGSRPAIVFFLCAALGFTGVCLLSTYGIAPPTPCGEDLAAACPVLK